MNFPNVSEIEEIALAFGEYRTRSAKTASRIMLQVARLLREDEMLLGVRLRAMEDALAILERAQPPKVGAR